jgi:hypothetical protein
LFTLSPLTGTNWEGTGVTPDVETSADDALATAQRQAAARAGETDASGGDLV